MSQVKWDATEELRELDPDDRAWLEARLDEYRDLLEYLHDH